MKRKNIHLEIVRLVYKKDEVVERALENIDSFSILKGQVYERIFWTLLFCIGEK